MKWFTPAVQAVLVQRRERRERARTALESYFQALPDEARAVVLCTKKRKKEGVDSTMGSASSAITIVGGTGCTSETTTPSKPGTDAQARRELERQRKEQEKQAEKDRKEKEKQAEKDRKEQEKQAEKERKEQERQGERDRKEQERLAERDRKELERLAEKERKDKEKSEKIEAKLAALAEKEAARVAKEEQRRLALEQKEQERLKAEQAQKRISGFFTAVKKDTESDTASRGML